MRVDVDNSRDMPYRRIDDVSNPRCYNYPKQHLWRLADIPDDMQLGSYDTGTQAIVLFPLFQNQRADAPVLDRTLEHHAVRSACWAYRSWQLYTDAVELKIPLRFYVEESVWERVAPIIEDNGFGLWDVMLFNGNRYEPPSGVQPHCGKKLAIFGDPRLAEYEWVLQVDSDLFMASPGGESYPFFEELLSKPLELGSLRINYEQCSLEEDLRWHTFAGLSPAQWYSIVASASSPMVASMYRGKMPEVPSIHGAMTLFPARRFFSDRKHDLEWLLDLGIKLQDDEAAFSVWRAMGRRSWSLCTDDPDSLLLVDMLGDLDKLRTRTIDEQKRVYLSHFNMPHEWVWRHDIGGLL